MDISVENKTSLLRLTYIKRQKLGCYNSGASISHFLSLTFSLFKYSHLFDQHYGTNSHRAITLFQAVFKILVYCSQIACLSNKCLHFQKIYFNILYRFFFFFFISTRRISCVLVVRVNPVCVLALEGETGVIMRRLYKQKDLPRF